MKRETYDLPAYKFAIIASRKRTYATTDEEYTKELDSAIQRGNCIIVPWENVDGLTIREVLTVLNKKGFIFACYADWEDRYEIPFKHNFQMFYLLTITPKFAQEKSDEPVDKVIENQMLANYTNANDTVKKVCRCFFERYQDRSHQETVDRIRKIEK